MLSPLLGRYTAEEFHQHIVRRICPTCEIEHMNDDIQSIMNYAWKNRQYGEWELFPSKYLERECRHYWLGRHEKTNRTSIQADNIVERRRRSIPNIKENVFYTMTNKMSAAGRLGAHKYENPETQDFTERTYYIADDIKAKNFKLRDKTIDRLEDL